MVVTLLVGGLIGLGAGVLAGLFGVGGGVVIVPALVALGLTQREATGTSLAALLLPVGLLAVIEYAKRQEVRLPYAIGIAIGLAVGALIGAVVAGRLSNVLLQRLFGVILGSFAIKFLFFPS